MSAGSREDPRPEAARATDSAALRALPSVDRLLETEPLRSAARGLPRSMAVAAAREALASRRAAILSGAGEGAPAGVLAAEAAIAAAARTDPSLRAVINATGIVIHTNLGRAPLAPAALEAIAATAGGYSNLEYEVDSGSRGSRHRHVESLVRELTGAEAAIAVNNNAAGVLLAVAALANGREVVISRGQLVEIGGSFRIPEIVAQSGARLVEVGTTNRTRLRDYRAAIGPDTAALMRVHPSNFRTVGFTEQVDVESLCALAQERGLAAIDDAGSGLLRPGTPDAPRHTEGEPDVMGSIAAGASAVCFSADKLLGGPQAGIVAGRAESIERLRAHPLARAVRIDKLSLAALEATLRLHLDSATAGSVPVVAMLRASAAELAPRARELAELVAAAAGGRALVDVVPDAAAQAGGGSLPAVDLPGAAVRVRPAGARPESVQERLRRGDPPVIALVRDGALVLHVRTLLSDQLEPVAAAVGAALRT